MFGKKTQTAMKQVGKTDLDPGLAHALGLADDAHDDAGKTQTPASSEADVTETEAPGRKASGTDVTEDMVPDGEPMLLGDEPEPSEDQGPEQSIDDDLGAMLDAVDAPANDTGADQGGARVAVAKPPRGSIVEAMTPYIVWASLALVMTALVYAAWIGGVDVAVAGLFGGGLLLFGTIMLLAAASKAYSPLLLTGLLFRRNTRPASRPAVLAGSEILSSLGLAEDILSADPEARLVTTRDGVVVYANEAYMRLAEEAGVVGGTGLPPRIERLFGGSGRESTKTFRLARAAKSAAEADEVITQVIGNDADGNAQRRRFEVAVRPMRTPRAQAAKSGQYVAWRLREVAIENARDDLRAAFQSYPRAVFALEPSGAIAWTNGAANEAIGIKEGQSVALSDFILGEAADLVAGLWEEGGAEVEARMRDKAAGAGHKGIVLTSFTRGGVGQGFVCVEMVPKGALVKEAGAADLSADLTDAPLAVTVLEGELGSDAKVTYANKMATDALGAEVGARFGSVLPADAVRGIVAAAKARSKTAALTRPVEVVLGEGPQARFFRIVLRPIARRRGAYGPRQYVLYADDVTTIRRMEEDHTHDQSLKQVGHLAGAIAHDFNNLLLVVMGSTELLMRRHQVGDPSYGDLVLIKENAQRARNLTQNLLAFSRKQTLQQEVLSVTEVLSDFTPFLTRYVTERVKLGVTHGRGLPPVKADKGQLELCLMNLAVNARDAMPGGGQLELSTQMVSADEVEGYGYGVLEDIDYLLIEIADDGDGVPIGIADRIFDPFFTTKGEGKGTGLGLSTVHGIIGQMGGRIFLYNRPGEGATFRIFLPALSEDEARAARKESDALAKSQPNENQDLTGKGRILIVEDEDGVRNIVVRALAMCGYEITEAEDGDEALEIIEDGEPFDLVLTDIMMPEMDGPTLITQAGDKLAGAKVIFMSGYAQTAMQDKLAEIEGAGYLQKPFTLKKVAAAVKDAMGSGAA